MKINRKFTSLAVAALLTVGTAGTAFAGAMISKQSVPENPEVTVSAQDLNGVYNYYTTTIYVKNDQTQAYELYKETPKHENPFAYDSEEYSRVLFDERGPIGQAADFDSSMEIKNADDTSFEMYPGGVNTSSVWHYVKSEKEWNMDWFSFNVAGERHYLSDGNSDDGFGTIVFEEGNSLTIVSEYVGPDFDPDQPAYPLRGKNILLKTVYKK